MRKIFLCVLVFPTEAIKVWDMDYNDYSPIPPEAAGKSPVHPIESRTLQVLSDVNSLDTTVEKQWTSSYDPSFTSSNSSSLTNSLRGLSYKYFFISFPALLAWIGTFFGNLATFCFAPSTPSPTISNAPSALPSAPRTSSPSLRPSELPSYQPSLPQPECPDGTIFINEFHYRNDGPDTSESIELVMKSEDDLDGHKLYFYDGVTGMLYRFISLNSEAVRENAEIQADPESGYTFFALNLYKSNNEVRDGPAGIALVDGIGNVVQFIAYGGGVITPVDGPAEGGNYESIAVSQPPDNDKEFSLQLGGTGYKSTHFFWQEPKRSTLGSTNDGQVFDCPRKTGGCPNDTIFINEFDFGKQDDVEFVEIAMVTGYNLDGHRLLFYDGSSGALYETSFMDEPLVSNAENGLIFTAFLYNSVESGPGGIALIDGNDDILQFIAYGDSFTAIDGAAQGRNATLIDNTSANLSNSRSIQLGGGSGYRALDFTWQSSQDMTPGSANNGQTIDCPGADE